MPPNETIQARTVRIPIREERSSYREPTLDEILSDSIVEAVMQADAVDPDELGVMLGQIARTLRAAVAGQASVSLRNGCSSGGRSVAAFDGRRKGFVVLGAVDQLDKADFGKARALVVGHLAGGLDRAAADQDIGHGFADLRAAGDRGEMLFAL